MPHKPGVGAIFGITAEDGVAAQKRVALMDRSNLKVVATTTADENGAYVFNGLNPETDDYLVFAVDDDGAPPKNALIHDYITPIPAHQGAEFPGNYYLLSRQHDPIFAFYGFSDPTRPVPAATDCSSSVNSPLYPNAALLLDQASGYGAAPYLPMIETQGNAFVSVARSGGTRGGNIPANIQRFRGYPFSGVYVHTFEFYVDLNTPFDIRYMIGAGSVSRTFSQTLDAKPLAMFYRSNSNAILYRAANTSGTGNNNGGGIDVGTFDVTGVSKAPHHFMVAVEAGVEARLYVDGAFHSSLSMASITIPFGNQSSTTIGLKNVVVASANGSDTSAPATTGGSVRFGIINSYGKKFTDAEVLALYESLATPSTPLVGAYDKEVVIDSPAYYFKFDGSVDTEKCTEFMSLREGEVFGVPTFGLASPIAGRSAVGFNGGGDGVLSNYRVGNVVNRRQKTLEAWLYFTGVPPTAQIIYKSWHTPSGTSSNEQVSTYTYRLIRNADNTLVFEYAAGGTISSATFVTPIATDQWVHVVITMNIDLASDNVALYLDGQFAEALTIPQIEFEGLSSSITPSGLSSTVYNAFDTSLSEAAHTVFGGNRRTDNGGIGSPYEGRISSFAMYPRALSPARISAHYEARNSV